MNALAEHGELLTPSELASFFGFSIHTIYKWNTRGSGPKRIKIGNKVYYRRDDVASWISSQESK